MKSPVRAAWAILLLLTVQRCERPLGYQVWIRNTSTQEIHNVRVSYGRFLFDQPIIMAGVEGSYLDVQEPLPAKALVEWRDASGKAHRDVVRVMPHSEFKGVLIFEIDRQNRVKVRTESPPHY